MAEFKKFELEHFRYESISRKIKNFQICGNFRSAINLGQQIANPQIAKNIGSANPQIAPHAEDPQM